ncbi:MAG TPA: site-specific integrase [Candidatus Moranbacteria bacterium]|nr:site-specific integrase [Candidatus Moranbacteria bacterium]
MNIMLKQNTHMRVFKTNLKIRYLSKEEISLFTNTFQKWFDESKTIKKRRSRGRYWLVYLFLRFTGARLGEILEIDDTKDIDVRNSEVRVITLKRKTKIKRIIPIPSQIITEMATYLVEFPEMRGKVFKVDQGNFRKIFYSIAKKAGIYQEYKIGNKKEIFPHPHTLRHTRAIELLANGVPVSAVQNLLGHSSLLTTAEYLKISNQDIKEILKIKGLI